MHRFMQLCIDSSVNNYEYRAVVKISLAFFANTNKMRGFFLGLQIFFNYFKV